MDMNTARAELQSALKSTRFADGTVDAASSNKALAILAQYPELSKEKYRCENGEELPLYTAVRYCAPLEVLQQLVSCYPEARAPKHDTDSSRCTPLHIACIYGNAFETAVFELLTTPEAARTPDVNGLFPLHYYCQNELASLGT